MLDLMKKHLAAYSAGNWDEYKADLASDVTYVEVATGQRATGADKYVELVKRWKRAFPDLKATVVGGFETADQMVGEIEWEGTQSGAYEGPLGTIQPTNKHGRINAVILAKLKDGKIVETRHYFDLLSLLMQLGISPMAGTGAQPAAKPAEAPPARH